MKSQFIYSYSSPHSNTKNLFSRPRINALLLEAVKKRLTIVQARAGFGKTMAVLSALDSTAHRVIWMQFTELDNLVDNLWDRFISVFKPINSNLYKNLTALGYPDSAASFHQFLKLIASEIERDKRYILVLDDFHLIHEGQILDFFEKLILSTFNNINFVIISRTKPSYNLAGMLSKGLLARITEDDLRFSKEEMDLYFKEQDIKLSNEIIDAIYPFTDGWIFVIYLISLATKQKEFNSGKDLIALIKSDIFGLIEEEIYTKISKKLQELLISISILNEVLAVGLIKELSGHDHELIAELNECCSFVNYDPLTESYKLHDLFKDFLLEKTSFLGQNRVADIHYTAAQWYERNNLKIEAVEHYQRCNHYNEIFDIILSIKQRVSKQIADLFIDLINLNPQNLVETRPIMSIIKANLLFNNNRISEAKAELLKILRRYESLPDNEENRSILGEAYITLGLISIVEQNFEFEELFRKADQCLPYGSVLVDSSSSLNIAEGLNLCGIKNPIPGELERYRVALFNAAPYIANVMNGCGYGLEYLGATDVEFKTGNLQKAKEYAYEAYYRALEKKQYSIIFMANFYLVRIHISKGDYTAIDSIFKQMRSHLEEFQNPECFSLYDIIEGWFFIKIGQPNKIAGWIIDEEKTRKMLAPVVIGREYLIRSDYMLALGKYDELLAFMQHQDKLYESRGILYALIQNSITRAIIYHDMKDPVKSMDALHKAYSLSEPNHLIMQYVEYGNKTRTLINSARKNPRCTIPEEWLDEIYTKSSTYSKMLNEVKKSHNIANGQMKKEKIRLSAKEHQVLACLCHALTREETAVECKLSINTVNSTLQIIFNKLGAMNSIDAVRIATRLDLI